MINIVFFCSRIYLERYPEKRRNILSVLEDKYFMWLGVWSIKKKNVLKLHWVWKSPTYFWPWLKIITGDLTTENKFCKSSVYIKNYKKLYPSHTTDTGTKTELLLNLWKNSEANISFDSLQMIQRFIKTVKLTGINFIIQYKKQTILWKQKNEKITRDRKFGCVLRKYPEKYSWNSI